MTGSLSPQLERLTQIFRRSSNKHEAHFRSREVLEEMACDPRVLPAVLEEYLAKPGVLNVTAFGSLMKDFTDHPDGVQFVHRNLAWLVAAGFIAFALRYRREPALRGVTTGLLVAILFQFVLGVFTVLTQVRIELGVLHQLGALLLLSTLLSTMHRTGRSITATAA